MRAGDPDLLLAGPSRGPEEAAVEVPAARRQELIDQCGMDAEAGSASAAVARTGRDNPGPRGSDEFGGGEVAQDAHVAGVAEFRAFLHSARATRHTWWVLGGLLGATYVAQADPKRMWPR